MLGDYGQTGHDNIISNLTFTNNTNIQCYITYVAQKTSLNEQRLKQIKPSFSENMHLLVPFCILYFC